MQLDSVRALKQEILESVLDPYSRALSQRAANMPGGSLSLRSASAKAFAAHPLGVSASPMQDEPHRTLALGVTRKGKDFRLALRIQRHSLITGSLVEQLTKKARGEVDVRVVGIIEKRAGVARRGRKPPAEPKSPAALIKKLSLPWYQGNTRPLLIGASIAHKDVTAGTIGCFVSKGGQKFVLSNNHVLANENRALTGDAVLQRAPFDGGTLVDQVTALAAWIGLSASGPNTVDAAIAEITSIGVDALRLRGVSATGSDLILAGVASDDPAGHTDVTKIGRTTGVTRGKISAFDLSNVVVAYDMGNIRFDGVTEIDPAPAGGVFSAGGDSGALIFNDRQEAMAMIFSGSDSGTTYATPMSAMLHSLGVELVLA